MVKRSGNEVGIGKKEGNGNEIWREREKETESK